MVIAAALDRAITVAVFDELEPIANRRAGARPQDRAFRQRARTDVHHS
jgi:hypothetical protein